MAGNVGFSFAVNDGSFKALYTRLKSVDAVKRREFNSAILLAVEPLADDIRQSAHATLPKKGGLANDVMGSKFSIDPKVLGMTFKMENPYSLESIDRGRLRHPIFGNRKNWAFQKVKPGFYSTPLKRRMKDVRVALLAAMETIAHEIEGR